MVPPVGYLQGDFPVDINWVRKASLKQKTHQAGIDSKNYHCSHLLIPYKCVCDLSPPPFPGRLPLTLMKLWCPGDAWRGPRGLQIKSWPGTQDLLFKRRGPGRTTSLRPFSTYKSKLPWPSQANLKAERKSRYSNRYLYSHVHSSVIHTIWNVEATRVHWQMNG